MQIFKSGGTEGQDGRKKLRGNEIFISNGGMCLPELPGPRADVLSRSLLHILFQNLSFLSKTLL